MRNKLACALLVAGCVAVPGLASAASEADCAAQWTNADANKDGVLAGAEADRYLAYLRIRAQVTPPEDGRIMQDRFMQACQGDAFMPRDLDPGAPLKGANSFTEGQARDRAIAAGLADVSALAKDGDGIWRGTAKKGATSVKVAVDFKGNVVTE